jgi:tetratricopeptide (TPR) repeat protein
MSLTKKQQRYIKKNHPKISKNKLSKHLGIKQKEVEKYLQSLQMKFSPAKVRLFKIIALMFPVLFFIFLELTLRVINYGGNLDLFISGPGAYSNYKMCNLHVTRRYFSLQSSVPDPSNDIFLKEKPENGYRIFVLGGSTAAGYPYSENLMFSRILNHRLSEAFPEKYIEVINTATAAINSYSLLDFLDEILENQPDAILIYAGHNEYYGAYGIASAESIGKFRWVVLSYLKLNQFKTFVMIRDMIVKIYQFINNIFNKGSQFDPTATLMERLVADQKITYQNPTYLLGLNQFRKNLDAILKKSSEKGVSVLVSELVSNIRDQKPFISVKTGQFPAADEVYQAAEKFENEKYYGKAKENYYQAKDLDALRFRASEDFNDVIIELSNQYGVPVVQMKSVFENSSPDGLFGNNLMLEHLHPNIDGYFKMADAFFDALRKNKFIADKWDTSKIISSSEFRQSWGVTKLDSLYGDVRIRVLKGGWPFKPKSLPNTSLRDYNPSTKAESLAVKIWTDKKYTLERGHVEMAEYYKKRKQYYKSYREYNSLICLTPYNISPYLEGANALIKAQLYSKALPILYKSLELEKSVYAYKWIGAILLEAGKKEESLPYLEKAFEMNPDDAQILYNLSGAYALNARYEKAKQILKKLYQINSNFPDADILKKQLDQVENN